LRNLGFLPSPTIRLVLSDRPYLIAQRKDLLNFFPRLSTNMVVVDI
jgi:hypothetical protein